MLNYRTKKPKIYPQTASTGKRKKVREESNNASKALADRRSHPRIHSPSPPSVQATSKRKKKAKNDLPPWLPDKEGIQVSLIALIDPLVLASS